MRKDYYIIFEIASKYCISDSFVGYNGYSISSKGFLPAVVQMLSRWQSSRTCAPLLLWENQNYKSLLNNHRQDNFGSHLKEIPHASGQRRSPWTMAGGAKSNLESNPIPARDTWIIQTNLCPHQDPETPQRLSQTCVWVSYGHIGQYWPATETGALCTATWVTEPVA